MRHSLTDDEKRDLERLIREAESRVKAQIVLAVIRRCDNYPEIPWKVFALTTSLSGLIVLIINIIFPGWITNALILISVTAILAVGALFALLTVLIPGFARLFLNRHRAESETRQYAEAMFFQHELFSTGKRSAILLMVSRFERQVILLPDKGTGSRLNWQVMDGIIEPMFRPLRRGELKKAMETGLEGLIASLEASAKDIEMKDELSNEIIEEEGIW
jgi:putative membrane protein